MSGVPLAHRSGPFVVFSDSDGLRHAIRLGGITALSDADECRDTTLLLIHGGKLLVLQESLDEVVQWFS